MNQVRLAEVSSGDSIGSRRVAVTRADLLRYAGASGDFNPIHWSQNFAQEVGLPGVIAHGMFTMGSAVQLVVDWCGDPGAILSYSTRFTKPVPVPEYPQEAQLELTGTVKSIDADAGTVQVNLVVSVIDSADDAGQKVLAKTQVVVRLG